MAKYYASKIGELSEVRVHCFCMLEPHAVIA
jgi:hypothetical protein